MKKAIVFIILLSTMLMFTSCGNSGNSTDTTGSQPDASQGGTTSGEDIVKGGTLNAGMAVDITSLLPTELRSPPDITVSAFIYENLFEFDAEGIPRPLLVDTYEEDPENRVYTFRLRQDVKFHDGTDFNAEVCKWNLDLYKEKGVLSGSFFSNVESVEVVDEYTVKVHFSKWDSTFLYGLARHTGIMTSKAAYESLGEDALRAKPVGTGPFKWVSREQDVKIELEKFEDYWRGEPYLDAVTISIYQEPLVAQAAMQTGEIQALFSDDFDSADALKAEGFQVNATTVPRTAYTMCYHSIDEPGNPFADLRVRQAVSYAVDSDSISSALFSDYYISSNQWAVPGAADFNDKLVGYPHNLEKAKELMKEAGYENGFDTVVTLASGPVALNIAQVIAEQLSKINVKVSINAVEGAGYVPYIGGWSKGILLHPMGLDNGGASQLAANFVQGLTSGLGIASFLHPDDVDSAIKEALSADSEASRAIFKDVQRMVFEDYNMMKTISIIPTLAVVSPKLHDSGLCETAYSRSTIWKAWLEQ